MSDLKLVESNLEKIPVEIVPEMYCFGGHNVAIEPSKIKTIDVKYYEDNETRERIPLLLFEMVDGTKLTIDYETVYDARMALKNFQKRYRINHQLYQKQYHFF